MKSLIKLALVAALALCVGWSGNQGGGGGGGGAAYASAQRLVVTVTGGTTWSLTADSIVLANGAATKRFAGPISLSGNVTTTFGANGADANPSGGSPIDVASVWLQGFVIGKDDGTLATLSSSASSTTLPAGYTWRARVVQLTTDGSANLVPGVKTGSTFEYDLSAVPNLLGSGTSSTPTDVDGSRFFPTTCRMGTVLIVAGPNGGACAFCLYEKATGYWTAPCQIQVNGFQPRFPVRVNSLGVFQYSVFNQGNSITIEPDTYFDEVTP